MARRPATAWLALCAVFAALALLVCGLPSALLDWQPARVGAEPWRIVTAAFVHLSLIHLGANLAGCAVLALLGWRADLGPREVVAALVALPLTQLGLLLRPDLLRYAGLSGALHALVAIAVLTLLTRRGRDALIGAAIAAGLVLKLVMEHPLGPALRPTPGFDFAVAPFAHLSGVMAGVAGWGLAWLWAFLAAHRQRAGV